MDGRQPVQRCCGGLEPREAGQCQSPARSSFLITLCDHSQCVYCQSGFNPVRVQTMVKTFEVCDLPVRVAKFISRKHWVITGAVSTDTSALMLVR